MLYDLGTTLYVVAAARRGGRRPRAAPLRERRNPREPDCQAARPAAGLPGHHRVRGDRRAADCQRDPVAPQFHPARAARPGEEPHPPRPRRPARRRDPGRPGLRDPRRPAQPLCSACRARVRTAGDDLPIAWLGARGEIRREARHARRDDCRHDRRPRSDQGGPRRAPALRRAHDALRAAAARQPRHLRDQRAAGSRGQDPGRPVQHPPGRGRPDQGLPGAAAARRAPGVQRQPGGLHRPGQDHHAAQGSHRLRDQDALPGDAPSRHGDHGAGGVGDPPGPTPGARSAITIPEFVREVVEEVAFQARQDSKIDKRSGVSQRLPISLLENVVSNAERRALLAGETADRAAGDRRLRRAPGDHRQVRARVPRGAARRRTTWRATSSGPRSGTCSAAISRMRTCGR